MWTVGDRWASVLFLNSPGQKTTLFLDSDSNVLQPHNSSSSLRQILSDRDLPSFFRLSHLMDDEEVNGITKFFPVFSPSHQVIQTSLIFSYIGDR